MACKTKYAYQSVTGPIIACVHCKHSLFLQQILRKDEKESKDLPLFLGFSPSGVVEEDVVYANFGTEKDFRKLKAMGVSVKNKIVLMRQGRVFRGNKVCTMPIYRKLPLMSPGNI